MNRVADITARLRHLERKKFPEADIQAERDLQFEMFFGVNRNELTGPIPRTEIERLKTLCFLDVEAIADRNGFNIEPGSDELLFTVLDNAPPGQPNYTIDRDDRVWLKYMDDDDEEPKDGDDEEDDYLEEYYYDPIPEVGFATKHYLEWIEMMVANELRLIPTTPDELRELKAKRDAKKFAAQRERERLRGQNVDQERDKVFGASRQIRPGTTMATVRKGSVAKPGREVKVEVVKRRWPKV